jgi:hypothetical protein
VDTGKSEISDAFQSIVLTCFSTFADHDASYSKTVFCCSSTGALLQFQPAAGMHPGAFARKTGSSQRKVLLSVLGIFNGSIEDKCCPYCTYVLPMDPHGPGGIFRGRSSRSASAGKSAYQALHRPNGIQTRFSVFPLGFQGPVITPTASAQDLRSSGSRLVPVSGCRQLVSVPIANAKTNRLPLRLDSRLSLLIPSNCTLPTRRLHEDVPCRRSNRSQMQLL